MATVKFLRKKALNFVNMAKNFTHFRIVAVGQIISCIKDYVKKIQMFINK